MVKETLLHKRLRNEEIRRRAGMVMITDMIVDYEMIWARGEKEGGEKGLGGTCWE